MKDHCTKVTLRKKRISNGRFSLYLDYYPPIRNIRTGKYSRREFLGIYIYENPKEKYQQEFNRNMLHMADLVRCSRSLAVAERDFGFTRRGKNDDFLGYFKEKMDSRHADNVWNVAYEYLVRYTGGRCSFSDLTVDFCQSYLYYVMSHPIKLKSGHLKASTANNYMDKLRCVLRLAFRENLIKEDVGGLVTNARATKSRRRYLSFNELKRLAAAPCEDPILKAAGLFSCLTGLRFSDVANLKWEDIYRERGGSSYMRVVTRKTETEACLPLGKEALALCGERTDGLVFKGLEYANVVKLLPRWVAAAGIEKHITFHCFRHTYATLQLAAGTDIYTISKLLTHSNLATTQIYTEITDKEKRKAANRISLE